MADRWSQFKVAFQWPKISEADAARIADAHNADCDAYEKRIAELEAEQGRLRQIILDDGMELARVMAESLRVVVDGDELIEDADTWRCLDNLLGLYCRERDLILIEGDEANRVRLERWETEDGN